MQGLQHKNRHGIMKTADEGRDADRWKRPLINTKTPMWAGKRDCRPSICAFKFDIGEVGLH